MNRIEEEIKKKIEDLDKKLMQNFNLSMIFISLIP